MCGFCGFTGNYENNENIINNMMDKIIHRGPDSAGFFYHTEATFGFRRLSFLDIENGSQPLYNEDKTIMLVFNGEIYNYEVLREELINKGHIFETKTDSEVLVHLYEEYKEEMLNKLRGMFAFAIYDFNENSLFLARDFFGIKPLYYTKVNNEIIFGSEIKTILQHPSYKKEINENALNHYLTFQYSVTEETFFKNIYKLMPSHYMVFKNGEINIKKYFEISFEEEDKSLENYLDDIEKVLLDSVEHHKIADVEVGSFLSSGVDSSFIASTFKGKKTFTVGFDYEKYNEIEYAKDLSKKLGLTNYNKIITTKEYWDILPTIQYHMDEPLADPSAVALYFVSDLAKDHVKAVMSGEGADEFFGGYNIYQEPLSLAPMYILPKSIRVLLAKLVKKLPNFKGKNFIIRASKDVEERFIGNAKIFEKEEKDKLLKKEGKDSFKLTTPFYDFSKNYDHITKMQYLDINFWLVGNILLKADKMSLANSLEVRVPFLDIEVFKVARKLPTKYRTNKEATKFAFRKVAKKYLPENVSSKKKLGFPVPIRIWLKEDKYYNEVKKHFESENSKKYFNEKYLIKLLDDHKKGISDNSRKIWTIYMFLVWYKQYFSEEI